jgi:hypothetical protein
VGARENLARTGLKKIVPDETVEEMIGRLQLYQGCWAIKIQGSLLVFPQETTRSQVESVLREGYALATGQSGN